MSDNDRRSKFNVPMPVFNEAHFPTDATHWLPIHRPEPPQEAQQPEGGAEWLQT